MFAYWQFLAFALARSLHGISDAGSQGFRDAADGGADRCLLRPGRLVAALAMVPVTRRYGARSVHAACLAVSGAAMLAIPGVASTQWLYLPMIGICSASMIGNP